MNSHDTSIAIAFVLAFGMFLLSLVVIFGMFQRPQVQRQNQSDTIQIDRELVRIAVREC